MEIDNFNIIKDYLIENNPFKTEKDGLYVVVLQRKKDHKETDHKFYLGTNNNNRLIKGYFIRSVEHFEKYYPEMMELAKVFNARVCINLNVRNLNDVSLMMMEHLAICIRTGNTNVSKLFETVLGQKQPTKEKRWIVDIDEKDMNSLHEIEAAIQNLKPDSNKILAKIPSKTGLHLITTPFNRQEFNKLFPEIDIQPNNPTNCYIP